MNLLIPTVFALNLPRLLTECQYSLRLHRECRNDAVQRRLSSYLAFAACLRHES
jgi:hypothetical protein